jgi:hypothetical protein
MANTKHPDSFNAHSKKTAEMLLFAAVRDGNLATLGQALQQGADINAQNERGETPLIIAVKNDQLECAKVLVTLRASLEIRDVDQKTARDHASLKRVLCSFKRVGSQSGTAEYQDASECCAKWMIFYSRQNIKQPPSVLPIGKNPKASTLPASSTSLLKVRH